jgi:hypothetical protein
MADTVSIVFDGPAGGGKSTVAKAVARQLGFTYVDTGAMYRGVTLLALEQGIPIDLPHQQEMLAATNTADFSFIFSGEELRIFHGSRDITEAVRSREVTGKVSYVAALPLCKDRWPGPGMWLWKAGILALWSFLMQIINSFSLLHRKSALAADTKNSLPRAWQLTPIPSWRTW